MRLRNDPQTTKTHWVRSAADLLQTLNGRWFALAELLSAGPPLLLIDDMGNAVVAASWMVAYGPSAQSLQMDWTKRDRIIASDVALRRSRFGDPPPASPFLFATPDWSPGRETTKSTKHKRCSTDSRSSWRGTFWLPRPSRRAAEST